MPATRVQAYAKGGGLTRHDTVRRVLRPPKRATCVLQEIPSNFIGPIFDPKINLIAHPGGEKPPGDRHHAGGDPRSGCVVSVQSHHKDRSAGNDADAGQDSDPTDEQTKEARRPRGKRAK